MPRALKTDKFFIHTAKKGGNGKNERIMGVNDTYEGGINTITMQDLIDFLKDNEIDLSSILVFKFFVYVRAKTK